MKDWQNIPENGYLGATLREANLYSSQERYAEAEPLFQEALKIAEGQLGVNNPNTITIRENLQSLQEQR